MREAVIESAEDTLLGLGITPFFTGQVSSDAIASGRLVRVTAVQRSNIRVCDGPSELSIAVGGPVYRGPEDLRPTVGDWVLLDERRERVESLLERKSVFKRVAAGPVAKLQLIAANIDTLFIVTSCNEEFKESRLERYVALAVEAGVSPVVVLTKADLTDEADAFLQRARTVDRTLAIEIVNALDAGAVNALKAWVPAGTTGAFVGSSGVGKSTLINTLVGQDVASTREIREQDSKGRHTTTYRSLHRLPGGGLLVDVPGMRELKMGAIGAAMGAVFSDIDRLARQCRYKDCRHRAEPGCAVRNAVEAGELDARRWQNYDKLLQEEARHSRSLADRRKHERRFSKVVKNMKALRKELGLKR